MYDYLGTVLRVVDGDTVHLALDLGLDVTIRVSCRLADINAPEMGTPEGPPARAALEAMIPVGSLVRAVTKRDRREKYGRYLVTLWPWAAPVDEPSTNAAMVDDGHAVYQSY